MISRLLIFLLSLIVLLPSALPAQAETDWVITGSATYIADNARVTQITGISLSGDTGTVPVKLLVSNGTLEMSTTTGLTFTGAETGSTLFFEGDVDDVNAALATLTYTRVGTGSDELEVSIVEPGEVFFEDTGNLYEYISFTGDWGEANADAASRTKYGQTGYLTTITSAAENDFVADRLTGAGWMGASDSAVEGDWKWVTGPETGDSFWSGAADGSAVGDAYENWSTGEPNNQSNEDCAQFLSGGSGLWNDLPCSGFDLNGYVVEYGNGDGTPLTAGDTFTITTVDSPDVLTLSPADDAEEVSRTTDLVLEFDEPVDVESGNISIYRASNDTLMQQIDVTSNAVSGSGTDTITVSVNSLPKLTELYVLVDGTAFDNAAGGSYLGISSTTAWSFTIKNYSSSPVITPINEDELSVMITNTAQYCEDEKYELSFDISASNATQYSVSTDPEFLFDIWYPVPFESFSATHTLPWISDGHEVYFLFGNAEGSKTRRELTVQLDASDCAEEQEEDMDDSTSEDQDEEATVTAEWNEEFERWQAPDSERVGPSPWNQEIEFISDVQSHWYIRGENYDTVYLVTEDGKRRPFWNAQVFLTYAEFEDVVCVTDATLATSPLGQPMLPKAQEYLVKVQVNNAVYAVTATDDDLFLHHIISEEVAVREYGENWKELVIDLPPTVFGHYRLGTTIE